MKICIFSYNRGAYLQNCLDSVQAYAPDCPTLVFDDHSDDPETLSVLGNLPTDVRLVLPERGDSNRHGGLYANMQQALDIAERGERLLFLQDDMQLVRPVTESDHQYIADFFARFPQAAFLNPVFLKGQRRRRDLRITRLNPDFPVYFRHYPQKKNPRGISYADVSIVDVERLKRVNWRFSNSEIGNAEQAQRHFGDMGFMAFPFVMFLPEVPVYRGKHKTLAVKLAEWRSGLSPKAYKPMAERKLKELMHRDLAELPVAENFLESRDKNVKRPFQYSSVNAFPLLRALHKLEQLFVK